MADHQNLSADICDLKPCPFCGEKRIFLNEPHPDGYRYGSINCPACLVVMPGEVASQEELIGCWNSRAGVTDVAQSVGMREALLEAKATIEAYCLGAAPQTMARIDAALSQPSPAATVEELRAFCRPLLGDVGSANDRAFERLIAKLFPPAAPVESRYMTAEERLAMEAATRELDAEAKRILHERCSAESDRVEALEAQGVIEQLEKQLAHERKKSEANFLHVPKAPLWRINLLCEQQELYTKDELVGLIQKVVQEAGPKERCPACGHTDLVYGRLVEPKCSDQWHDGALLRDAPQAARLTGAPDLAPLADRWPLGCHSPNSCSRNSRCMYVGCKHDGKDIGALASPLSRPQQS